jgi:hypothetical protein
MSSNMFMPWVEDKMVLVSHNTPYHHKCLIGLLASFSKKKHFELMVEHSAECINLPLTDKQMELVEDDVVDHGNCIQICFYPDEQNKEAGAARKWRIVNGEKLKMAFIDYLRNNKPEMLECKVEKFLHNKGCKVIQSPPY